MAAIDLGRLTTDFIFSGDPVIATVTPGYFTEGSTFRQIVVQVSMFFYPVDYTKNQTHQFVLPATENGAPITADISSALRSTFAQWEYDASSVVDGATISYPYVSFRVKAWEREMTSYGEVEDKSEGVVEIDGFQAYMGRVGEYERWKYPTTYPDGTEFSTKPAGEIYGNGFLHCTSVLDGAMVNTTVAVSNFGNDERPRTTFLFVNSRGVFETVSVLPRQALGYEITSSRKHLTQSPSYATKPVLATHKQGGGAVWQFSSGYVNVSWADWFASEFLMAKRYWMQHDGRWLPVAIEPDGDTVTVCDRNDPSLLAVNFTVRSAVSGSIR